MATISIPASGTLYYTTGSGLTLEQRENNMARRNGHVTYQIVEAENGFILSLPDNSYGTNKQYVFNAIAELNQFLADNNQEVFIK